MHTTLAFMTLRERKEVGEGEELMLIKPNEANEELKEEIEYHTLARIACLLVRRQGRARAWRGHVL